MRNSSLPPISARVAVGALALAVWPNVAVVLGGGGFANAQPARGHQGESASWIFGPPKYAEQVTTGGRGGRLVRVANLNGKGPGSLRAAVNAEGARIIVFDVAGTIDLDGDSIEIKRPHVTIAGQTAPSPGITLIRGGLIVGGHDVVIQHLRIRPGDLGEPPRSGRDIDSITTWSAYNVVVDHCSLTWATDENLSASGPRFTGSTPKQWREGTSRRILFSNNIIAEGLAHSTHAKGEHSKGSLIHDNVDQIVIYRNLYSSNFERSPLFKGGVRGAVINNVIYNPGQRAVHYNLQGLEWGTTAPEVGHMDLVGNVMRAGPSTARGLPLLTFGGEGDLSLFAADNVAVDRWGRALPALGRYTVGEARVRSVKRRHMTLRGLPIASSRGLEALVLTHVGARPWDRDGHDVRVLADVAEGRGHIIDSQEAVGGYPRFKARHRPFNPADWEMKAVSPRTPAVLDAFGKARGT